MGPSSLDSRYHGNDLPLEEKSIKTSRPVSARLVSYKLTVSSKLRIYYSKKPFTVFTVVSVNITSTVNWQLTSLSRSVWHNVLVSHSQTHLNAGTVQLALSHLASNDNDSLTLTEEFRAVYTVRNNNLNMFASCNVLPRSWHLSPLLQYEVTPVNSRITMVPASRVGRIC